MTTDEQTKKLIAIFKVHFNGILKFDLRVDLETPISELKDEIAKKLELPLEEITIYIIDQDIDSVTASGKISDYTACLGDYINVKKKSSENEPVALHQEIYTAFKDSLWSWDSELWTKMGYKTEDWETIKATIKEKNKELGDVFY